jgi:uncharacterized protein (DUF1330 family)|tara:strand:+ start:145 stop:507 length:363 start_codon:yes stop_codon:yes gene_type:complete
MTRFVTVLLVINLSVLFSPLLAQERPAYVLTEVTIHDRIAYQEYEAEFMPIVERYGGELIAVTDDPTVLEGLWSEMRVVLIRFETRQDALDWYDSQEYQQLAVIRRATSTGTDLLINGRR